MLEGKKLDDDFCIIVYNPSWHKGVIGIVASRLVEHFYRPAMVFTKTGEGQISASARSMHDFDIYNAIERCQDIIEQFGGHKYAAGLTLKEENFEAFKKRINDIAREAILPEMRTPVIEVDTEIRLSEITSHFLRTLKKFAPFGPGNNSPIFMARGLKDNGWGKAVGKGGQHLKLTLMEADGEPGGRTYDAIGFNLGEKKDLVSDGKRFKAVFCIEENEYQGRTSPQIRLKDINRTPRTNRLSRTRIRRRPRRKISGLSSNIGRASEGPELSGSGPRCPPVFLVQKGSLPNRRQ